MTTDATQEIIKLKSYIETLTGEKERLSASLALYNDQLKKSLIHIQKSNAERDDAVAKFKKLLDILDWVPSGFGLE